MDVIMENKIYILICEMIMKLTEFQACVQPCLDVIFRLIKTRKSESNELIKILISDNFMTVIYIIIRTHECNMKIMTSIFSIICLIYDKFDCENFCYLLSFQKLREIFNIYKMNGFEMIHEVIIHLIRNLVNKRQELMKKLNSIVSLQKPPSIVFENNETHNSNSVTNSMINSNCLSKNNNVHKSNYSKSSNNMNLVFGFLNNSNTSKNLINPHKNIYALLLKDDEIFEIFFVFVNSIQRMKSKVSGIQDLKKSSRHIFNIINNIFIICNVIVIILENNPQKIQVVNNFKVSDLLISILLLINDTELYRDIDDIQAIYDVNSLSNKILVLKKLYFANKVIKATVLNFPRFKVISNISFFIYY